MTNTMSTPANIPSGQSQSQVIDLDGQVITAIRTPDTWDAASISFLGSTRQAGPYVPVYDAAGVELIVTAGPDRYISISPASFRGVKYCKLRSGVAATPVNQGDNRFIELLVELSGGA